MGTSLIVPTLFEAHQQVHVKRQIGNAQALQNLLQCLAPHELGGTLRVGDAEQKSSSTIV